MIDEELQTALKERMSTVKSILQLHSEGKSSQEISTKLRVAMSYIVDVLKKGHDTMLQEISAQYGIQSEDIPEEKSSLKKEEKKKKPAYPKNHEFICIDCTESLTQIEDFLYEGNAIRMYQCEKCSKVYPHTLDSQKYFGV